MKQTVQEWVVNDKELSKKEKMAILRDNAEWERKGSRLVERFEPRTEEEIRAMQATVPHEGEVPTPEELISHLADTVRGLMDEFGISLDDIATEEEAIDIDALEDPPEDFE